MMSPAQFAVQQAGFTVPEQSAGAPGKMGFVAPSAFAAAQGTTSFTAPPGAKRPRMEAPMGSSGGFSSVQQLQDEVKKLQRSEPNAKEQWISWCDQYGEGKRDPGRHTEEFLQTFLASYKTGMRLPGEAENLGIDKVTKSMQRRSRPFKEVWAQYCVVNGGGKSDPLKHPAQHHMAFYDYLASVVNELMQCVAEGSEIRNQISEESPCIKRLRLITPTTGNALPEAVAQVPGVAKDALVAQIKAYQRMGEEQRTAWQNYCDRKLGGARDPARHDTNSLLQFALQIVDNPDGLPVEVEMEEETAADGGTASSRWKRAMETASKPTPLSLDPSGSY